MNGDRGILALRESLMQSQLYRKFPLKLHPTLYAALSSFSIPCLNSLFSMPSHDGLQQRLFCPERCTAVKHLYQPTNPFFSCLEDLNFPTDHADARSSQATGYNFPKQHISPSDYLSRAKCNA